jgi:hypothetical protein
MPSRRGHISSSPSLPQAREVWKFFHHDFDDLAIDTFTNLWLLSFRTYEEATINTAILWNIWKRRNALTFNIVVENLATVTRRCL